MSDSDFFVVMYDGYPIPKAFFDQIQQQLEKTLPTLKRSGRYKARPVLGEAFWESLTNGERRMAGKCLAHLVSLKRVPLHFVKSNHEYPKFYRLN